MWQFLRLLHYCCPTCLWVLPEDASFLRGGSGLLSRLAWGDLGCRLRSCPPGNTRMLAPAVSLSAGSRSNASLFKFLQSKLIANTILNVNWGNWHAVWSETLSGKLQVLNSKWLKHEEGIIGLAAPNLTGFRNGCSQLFKQWFHNLSLFLPQLCFLRYVLLLLWEVSH